MESLRKIGSVELAEKLEEIGRTKTFSKNEQLFSAGDVMNVTNNGLLIKT